MKKLILLLVITLMLATTGAQAQSQSSWATYFVKEDDLSVAFPKQPELHQDREESARNRRRSTLSAFADSVQYTIYVIENPEPPQTLAAFIEEQTNSKPKWQLKSEQDL